MSRRTLYATFSPRVRQNETIPDSATRMYALSTPSVAVSAMNWMYVKGAGAGLVQCRAKVSPSRNVIKREKPTPTQGVRQRGCVQANTRGKPPSRPIAKNVRAVRCRPASEAMKALVITAMSTSTDSQVPEYRFASVSSGATSCAHLAEFATPKPTDIVQVMKTYQTTATTAAVRIARGIARTPAAPITSCVRVERRMSKNAKRSNPPRRIRKHWNQLGLQLVCWSNSVAIVTAPIERTNEIPTANAVPYSQPPMKPPFGCRPRAMYV